jgi:hypothetical protein
LKLFPALLLLLPIWAASAMETRAPYVQAVEFPYYLYPRALWERELVWLKNIGVQTVAFSVPHDYHEVAPGEFDITGRTGPRRDLTGFIKTLRKLGMRGWVRADGPHDRDRDWVKLLEQMLTTQTAAHGGPIAFVDTRTLAIDAPAPPTPLSTVSAVDPDALARSREALARGGALLWTNVEDALYPAGWPGGTSTHLRKGAVGLSGDEHPATSALRRNAALLRSWGRLLTELRPAPTPRTPTGKLPSGINAIELTSGAASAISITNIDSKPFHDDLRVQEPVSRHPLVIPGVKLAPGQSLWLPLSVSLGPNGLCADCTNFAATEHIVYATSELLAVEYENGILAMEFAAPEPGEVILQLERRPVGPFLAAGKPTDFDWDEPHMRARLPVPASKQQGNRVRIGIAIEAPETSAFFNELHRLVIGRKNTVSTIYSSAQVAGRSRLRLPEGYSSTSVNKSPNEIDYEITVPADALHGDFASFSLEADGMALGRARVQLFRPASIRLLSGVQFHIGPETEITPEPPIAAIDPRGGSNIEIAIRNNSSQIQNYHLDFSGDGLDFLPAKTEFAVAPTDERRAEIRVFAHEGIEGLREFVLKVTGGADVTMPMRLILVPRNTTVVWSADLDGDGQPEWVLESQKVRAIFSPQDGGRWMEFTWKDTNTNFLPESGALGESGPVEIRVSGSGLEFIGKGGKRTVRLEGTALSIEQQAPLPAETLAPAKRGSTTLSIEHPAATRAIYTLK